MVKLWAFFILLLTLIEKKQFLKECQTQLQRIKNTMYAQIAQGLKQMDKFNNTAYSVKSMISQAWIHGLCLTL